MTDEERQKELEKAIGGCLASGCFIVVLLIAPWLWCEFRGAEYRWQYSAFAVCVGIVFCHVVTAVCVALPKRRKGGE